METQQISRVLDTNIGAKYLAINNNDLHRAFRVAADAAGADTSTAEVRTHSDTKLLMTVDLPRLAFDMPELGGKITPRLWLKNDNSGGSALSVGIGLYRWVCSNGLYVGVQAFGTRLAHRDGPHAHRVLDALPGALTAAMDDIASGAALDLLMDASAQGVTDPIDVIGSLDLGARTKQAAIDNVLLGNLRVEDNPNTVWGLYNIVNEAARFNTRSTWRTANRDMSLLTDIQALAGHQVALSDGDMVSPGAA